MVVLLHLANYLWTPEHSCLFLISRTCGIAIPLFFTVSGYLMAGKEVSWRYSFHKIVNILKVTLLVCIVYDLYTYIRYQEVVLSFPICLLQRSEWWHLWYFGTMIIIYLLLPFLARIIDSRRWKLVFITLISISSLMWILDIAFRVEENYICQTFRLWYFLLYFFIGAFIKKEGLSLNLKIFHVLFLAVLYTISVLLVPIGSIEYHFGSPLCALYAVSFFLFIQRQDLSHLAKRITFLSSIVLPAYLFHTVIIRQLIIKVTYPSLKSYINNNCVADLVVILLTIITVVVISWIITQVPKYDKVFKL